MALNGVPTKYPEQSKYVKGKKIWLNLPNDQTIIVSAQARDVLKFHKVDEAKFIQKMRELLSECFTDLITDKRGYTYSFERLSVSKASSTFYVEDGGEAPFIKIEIYDCTGKKKTVKTSQQSTTKSL